jgi:carbon-monoxide dehydrogenase large subunit
MGPDAGGPPMRVLAEGDVRYVGEPIAIVLADSRARAEDAAELIEFDIEPEPAVVRIEQALNGPVRVHPERDSNVSGEVPLIEQPEVAQLFNSAAHVVSEHFTQHRYLCVPMETRGILAAWDRWAQTMEIVASTQTAHESRRFRDAKACKVASGSKAILKNTTAKALIKTPV